MVGDLSDEEWVLVGIGLVPKELTPDEPSKDVANDEPR
jgi:hypothetical protein